MKSFLSSLHKLDSSNDVLRDRTAFTKQVQALPSLFKNSKVIDKSMRKGIPGISLSLYTSLLMIGTSIGIGITFNPQRSWAGSTCVGTYSSRSGVTIDASGAVVASGTSSVIGYFNSITNSYVPLVNYTGGNNINAIAVQPSTGNLYFVNRTTGKVVVFNVNTNVQTTLSGTIPVSITTGSAVIGATFNASGKLYVYYSDKKLIEVDPTTGGQSGVTISISGIPGGGPPPPGTIANNTTVTGGNTNGDIAIGTDGLIYILGDTSTINTGGVLTYTSRLYTLTISGTTATAVAVVASNITGLGGSAANGLAIDPATGKFYISSSLGTYELNTATNSATQLTTATGTGDLGACGSPVPDLPTITKAFNPNNVVGIPANSTLTLTLGNTNQVPIYLISTLVDNFQTGLAVRSPNGLGGTCLADTANNNKVTAVANSNSISLLNGLKVPAGGCTVTVNVTASNTGTFINTIAAGELKTTAGNNPGSTTGTLVVVLGDYGDAPITGTAPSGTGTNAYSQAIHGVISGIKLGAVIDSETGSIANANASGDGADDDSISSFPTLTAGGTSYSIPAANITATGTGTLHAWIDFNKNGTFDVGEYTSAAVVSDTLSGDLNWTGITAGAAGNTFARFRFTSDATVTASTPSGIAADGEVEDYQILITPPVAIPADIKLIKRITEINSDRLKNPNDTSFALDQVLNNPATTSDDPGLNWPSGYLVGSYNAGLINPKDVVEYTVYFLNARGSDANTVRFCDQIVGAQQFLADAYGVGKDIEYKLGANAVQYLTKASLTSVDRAELNSSTGTIVGCPIPSITGTNNGTVIVDVTGTGSSGQQNLLALPGGTAPGVPTNSYGYFRFKTKVNP